MGRTIELDKLISLRSGEFPEYRTILGLHGDDNIIFVSTCRGVFMVNLKLMLFEKIFDTSPFSQDGTIHPFKTLYAPGTSIRLHCKYAKSLVFPPYIIGLMNTARPSKFKSYM